MDRVGSIREALSGVKSSVGKCRALTESEVKVLESNGNTCVDGTWTQVKVLEGCDLSLVRSCTFKGDVILGKLERFLDGARGLPGGIYFSTLDNVVLEGNARISNCELVSSTFIGEGSVLSKCGFVTKSKQGSFGNGISIPVAIGSGGREVTAFAHLTLEEAARLAVRRHDKEMLGTHQRFVSSFVDQVTSSVNIIDSYSRLEGVTSLTDVYIGPFAQISFSRLESVTVLSAKDEPTVVSDSHVKNAVLQHNVHVESGSFVENSMMLTCSHAERHGLLMDSILGPFSGVAEGEISSSLVGPFVGFHHQALLIASFWPAGRGNIGYGANVGSNHTGKAPDQELWHGEGVFYGLASAVKFPSDFSHAPYSLVATGVTTLPQRVTMPFSLISAPSKTIANMSSAINEIFPAWVLSQNMYSVLRNEHKFKTRGSKSKRVKIDFRIFRPLTIKMIRIARDELANPSIGKKDIYTERDFPGLGKNFMTHKARQEAVETYTFFLFYYAVLQGVWSRLESCKTTDELSNVAQSIASDLEQAELSYVKVEPEDDYSFTGTLENSAEEREQEWRLQCSIIRNEASRVLRQQANPHTSTRFDTIILLLEWLGVAKESIANKAMDSKMKDEIRGAKIIPGYLAAHGSVKTDDELVARETAAAKETATKVSTCIEKLAALSNNLHAKL